MPLKFIFVVLLFNLIGCKNSNTSFLNSDSGVSDSNLTEKQKRVSDAALSIVDPNIVYDPSYLRISYPNGDVPPNTGVCTDVVIRAYRELGVDLQKEVHEDMLVNFHLYPKIWGLTKPDTNIDHRRVPNLMVYFSRFGTEKPITNNPEDYQPGDIISWRLGNGRPHTGIVVDKKSVDGERFQVVHNIGMGQIAEDVLFNYEIIGHHSYQNFE